MALWNKLFARRIARHRRCRFLRLMLEKLEPRDCPAVQAFFAGGVLTVVGDEGNNVIDLFQPQDRVVEVVGDGETWVFKDVDEVIVDAGDGGDELRYSKPKEIVVVGSKINMHLGPGEDLVQLSDGVIIDAPRSAPSTMSVSIDLGTGEDELSLAMGNTDLLDVALGSDDGNDRVHLSHTIGLRHEHTRPESIVRMDLAGSGTLVDVDFDNIEQVDLSIVSQPVPGEPAAGGAVFVHWHVFGHDSTFIGRNDGFVQMISASSGGSAGGVSPTSLSFSATAGGAIPSSSASVKLALGSDDDTVSMLSDNVDLQLAADLGAGDDSFAGNYRLANGSETVVDVEGGAGRDAIADTAEFNAGDQVIDFSALFQNTQAGEVVNLDLRNAPVSGDLSVRAAVTGESDASRISTHLVPWQDVRNDDLLLVDVVSFEQVDLRLETNPKSDRPELVDLAAITYYDPAMTSVHLADRDDGVRLETMSWSEVHLGYETLEPTSPTPDPGALVSVRANSTVGYSGPHTRVLLDDGDDGLHVQAANFNDTRLTLEATNPSPILPDRPEKLDLNGVSFSPAAGSQGPGEFVVPSLVKLDVHPSMLQAELLIESSGPGSALVTGQLPAAAGSDQRPRFVSKLSVVDDDALTQPLQTVTLSGSGSDPSLPALDVDTSLAGAAEYELENEAEFIPVVRFAVNAPDQQAALKVTPRDTAAGISATPAVKLKSFANSTFKSLSLDLTTGDEDDLVDATARGWDQVTNKMYTGGGDDLIGWNFVHGDNDPSAPTVASHHKGVDVWASIDAGGGNDAISFVNADANSLELILSAGLGDDNVTVHGQSSDPSVFVRDPKSSGMVIDLGDGTNQLKLVTSGFDEVTEDLRGGLGSDRIEVADRALPSYNFQLSQIHHTIRTGDGDDIVLNESEGRQIVDTLIDLGSGNDAMGTRWGTAFSATTARLNVAVLLGPGSDQAELDALGFGRIALVIYTGPAGNGRDLISGSILLSPTDKLRRIRRTADGRQDLLELFVSAAYDVQLSSDETTFYVLIGTPPPK
jgi:hypothetical protein